MSGFEQLIDRFVEKLRRAGFEALYEDELPELLQRGERGASGFWSWEISKVDNSAWVAAVEALLPKKFPPSYLSLVKRYLFPAFQAGPLFLFADTGLPVPNDLERYLRKEPRLFGFLVREGLIPFARPDAVQYDPICFDARGSSDGGEYPIVQVNHEQILSHARVEIKRELFSSFWKFVEEFVA
jgi:hypothetical protein